MTCPLVRVGCWNIPLILCGVQCVLWDLVKFLLWIWVLLHLGHRCSELRLSLGGFSPWQMWSVLLYHTWEFLVSSLFYWILGWQRLFVSCNHLLGRYFHILSLWDSFCLCCWGMLVYAAKFWIFFMYPLF